MWQAKSNFIYRGEERRRKQIWDIFLIPQSVKWDDLDFSKDEYILGWVAKKKLKGGQWNMNTFMNI